MEVLFVYRQAFLEIICSEVIYMGRITGKILALAGVAVVAAGTAAGYVFFDGLLPEDTADNAAQNSTQTANEEAVKNESVNTDAPEEAAKEVSISDGLDETAVFTYEIYNDITQMSDSVM